MALQQVYTSKQRQKTPTLKKVGVFLFIIIIIGAIGSISMLSIMLMIDIF